MRDTIYRDDAIRIASGYCHPANVAKELEKLPSAEPEQAKYVPDTKAIPSSRDCVDLSERVTATFYDDEHEEWSQKTVTIQDVLDSVCDDYTVLPSAEPERRTGRWERHYSRPNVYADLWWHCSVCGYKNDDQFAYRYHHYCPVCGAKMEVEP